MIRRSPLAIYAPRMALAALAIVAGAAGCTRMRCYSGAALPEEFQAPQIVTPEKLDLSQFAGPASSASRVDAGDVLEISVGGSLSDEDLTTFCVRVGEDGTARLPEVGQLQLAGLETIWAEQQIATACVQRGLYRQPNVTVSIRQRQQNRITVLGAVQQPGAHELPRGSSYLLDAVLAAGGLAKDAGTGVEIRSPAQPGRSTPAVTAPGIRQVSNTTAAEEGNTRVCLNLAETINRPGQGTYLPDGSVVRVEQLELDPVQVLGLVQKPGEIAYPIKYDLRLLGAIAQAGGLSSRVADKVLVIRKSPKGQERVAIEVSLQAAKRNPAENIRLAPGDVVSVEQTPATMAVDAFNALRFGVGANVPVF